MARNLRDKLNRVHGIGVVRHADLRSSGGLPAGAADGAALPAGDARPARAVHGHPDQQRRRPTPSRALLRAGPERCRHRGADRRQLHRPRRAPHGGRPEPGFGGADGGRRLRRPRAAARRLRESIHSASASWASPRAAWRRSTPPSPCASAGASGFPHLFDLHVAICPGATAQHRDATTHGRPMFFMLAARDDYTPAPLAIEYAERMRSAGNDRIKVKVYGSAHHGWESIGPVFDIKDAENWSCCKNFIEDDGSHFIPAAGRAMSEPDYQAWARQHCVTKGARAGGGTPSSSSVRRRICWRFCIVMASRLNGRIGTIPRYTCGVIRLRFLAFVLAFVVPTLGWFPASANETLWVGSDAGKVRADALLKAIRSASDHGLQPAWYRVGEVEKALAAGSRPGATETLLTAAFIAYASDVSTGRVRANRVDKDIDIQQRKVEPADLLKAAAGAADFPAYLDALPPKGDYPALQKALAAWRDRRAKATFTPLPDGIALKPGMIDPRVPLLRKRAGRARPRGSRAGRGGRSLRRAAGRRGEGLPGDQRPDGRRRGRRQDDAVAQHHDRRAHRADRGQSRAPALAAGGSRQALRDGQCRRLLDGLRRRRQAAPSRAW